MAKLVSLHCSLILITIAITLTSSTFPAAAKPLSFSTTSSKEKLGLKEEKITHLHFYMHDVFGGQKNTSIPVTPILDNNTFYGAVFLADDPLTLGPERDSQLVGNGRGTYTFPSQNAFVLEKVYDLGFTYGKYNGSSLCLLGSVAPTSVVV